MSLVIILLVLLTVSVVTYSQKCTISRLIYHRPIVHRAVVLMTRKLIMYLNHLRLLLCGSLQPFSNLIVLGRVAEGCSLHQFHGPIIINILHNDSLDITLDILCNVEYLITGVPKRAVCACHAYITQAVYCLCHSITIRYQYDTNSHSKRYMALPGQ